MRRTIVVAASIVTVLVVVAGTVVAQTTRRFSDVPANHPAVEAIHWAADAGITTGWPDGTFRPEQPLHRSHAIIFMDRFYEQVLQATQSDDFTRADMMVLLHTIATAVPAATTTASHPRDVNHPNLRTALDAVAAEHPETARLLGDDGVRYRESLSYRESTPTDRPCGRVFWFIRDSCLYPSGWIVYDSNWDDPDAPHRFVFHIGMALFSTVHTLIIAMEEEGLSTAYWPVLHEFYDAMASDCSRVGPYACQPESNFWPYAYAGEAFAASVFAPQYGLAETATSTALVEWLIEVLSEAPCAAAIAEEADGRLTFRCTQRRN